MEVVDPQAARRLEAERFLEAIHQLGGSLDVVCQDQDVLRLESWIRGEQVAHALDDHRRLAGSRAREHHQRPGAPLDSRPLLSRQLEAESLSSTLTHRNHHSLQSLGDRRASLRVTWTAEDLPIARLW